MNSHLYLSKKEVEEMVHKIKIKMIINLTIIVVIRLIQKCMKVTIIFNYTSLIIINNKSILKSNNKLLLIKLHP